MAEALFSRIRQSLGSIIEQQMRGTGSALKPTLVKLATSLEKLQLVAGDAENKQRRNHQVNHWIQLVKEICYDVEDVVDKWSTVVLKRKIKEEEEEEEEERINEEAAAGPWQQQPPQIGERLVLLLHKLISRHLVLISNFPLCSSCLCCDEIGQLRRFARDLKALSEKLEEVTLEAYHFNLAFGSQSVDEKYHSARLTTSFIDTRQVWGRDDEKQQLVRMLLDETASTAPNLRIISITGMGGMGKTTLAKMCYNDENVKSHFDRCIWVSVSRDFDVKYIAKAIIESQVLEKLHDASPSSLEPGTLLELMTALVKGKRFLLVLDDVWEEDHRKWENLISSLQSGGRGSKILVTSRNDIVARVLESEYVFHLGGLSRQESWFMFRQFALEGYTGGELELLKEIGEQIVARCQGMPLAAKALAAVLRTKRSRKSWLEVLHSDIFKLDDIMSPLLLSYYDMPSTMRVCFSYCATFPKGFQIENHRLIRLWMAQGYLDEVTNGDFETRGEAYIRSLVMRSMLMENEDHDGGGRKIKMHDLVHDLALSCSQGECLGVEFDDDDDLPSEARHLTLVLSEEGHLQKLQDFINMHNKQRSLLLQSKTSLSGTEMQAQLSNLFTRMTLLRSLDLTGCSFRVLPATISNLVLLRLLILSMNEDLEELPEEICDLCNLQTFEANWCRHLKGFPKGIGKLVSLRHLGNVLGSRSPVYLPKGIGRLITLRTLLEFNVGRDDDESASLADLRDLNQLGGHVCINGLGNVTDVGEARYARLRRKTNITSLELNFQREEGRYGEPIDEVLLIEALQPHSNLEELVIVVYRGTEFPSWLLALSYLRKISLLECDNCERLPPLGKLPCLEELVISFMPRVETVGEEFSGTADTTGAGVPSSSSSVIAFPVLKTLKVGYMPRWKEWSDWSSRNEEEGKGTLVLPSLRSLCLKDCPELGSLPGTLLQSSRLEELNVNRCPLLEQRYAKEGTDWPRVAHIPKIQFTSAQRDSL